MISVDRKRALTRSIAVLVPLGLLALTAADAASCQTGFGLIVWLKPADIVAGAKTLGV
jgi:hypothetical protein